jgi:nicotinate phosphoribosyltransferase
MANKTRDECGLLKSIYGTSLALMTDLYQLTMAYAYWKRDMVQKEAVFHLFFRRPPFHGGFTIAAGLEAVIDYIQNFKFDRSDIDYLKELVDVEGNQLFPDDFLAYLADLKLTVTIDAVPEGTVVFPYQPLIRVQGPLIQCQLLESPLLNLVNFPSLIATKAARTAWAADGDEVLEFGLRRAQGVDGALTASRSAFLGGCNATSNVLAGKLFGIPVKGTHAHSWVMAFDDELESFYEYAKAMPTNCVFLVDTYNTLEGVKKAIEVGHWLRKQGRELLGIRLDSGDLNYLSIESRKMLDNAGLANVAIVASNELDENLIKELKLQGSKIAVWGVGTNLVTAKDHPALDGVYKISAIRNRGEKWHYTLKLSEQLTKISTPGVLQVRRYFNPLENVADVIYNVDAGLSSDRVAVDPFDPTREKKITADLQYRDLLEPIFDEGHLIYQIPDLVDSRKKVKAELSMFHQGIKRFINPHQYVVGLDRDLYQLKVDLIRKVRTQKRV